jgi:predicted negative regulator of RcsB-dependent stress response
MAKEFTEEELEQDPLINSYAKTRDFYIEHKKVIIGSAVVVLLAIALAIGYHYYQKSQNQEAQQLMGMAETFYLQGDYERALTGSEEDFTIGFQQIADNYSRTQAGNLAHYYAAVSEYNLGNTQQALSYMQDYEAPAGILGVAPLSFHGVLLTEVGNHLQAAKIYVKAAEWDENPSTAPYNYLEAAKAFHDSGEMENAKTYARLVIDEYENSSQVAEANKLLGRLMAANGK